MLCLPTASRAVGTTITAIVTLASASARYVPVAAVEFFRIQMLERCDTQALERLSCFYLLSIDSRSSP